MRRLIAHSDSRRIWFQLRVCWDRLQFAFFSIAIVEVCFEVALQAIQSGEIALQAIGDK